MYEDKRRRQAKQDKSKALEHHLYGFIRDLLWELNEKTGRRLVSTFLRLEMAILMYHLRSKLGHSGVIFKAVGNAFQAAFASAPRALRAAIEGQRALQAAQWKDMGEQHLKGMEWLEQVCVPG